MTLATDLSELTAAALLPAYRDRRLSPVEVLEASLARIERDDRILDAFCLVDADRALAEARRSEERWRRGAPPGALDGVPVATAVRDEQRGQLFSAPLLLEGSRPFHGAAKKKAGFLAPPSNEKDVDTIGGPHPLHPLSPSLFAGALLPRSVGLSPAYLWEPGGPPPKTALRSRLAAGLPFSRRTDAHACPHYHISR